MSERPPEAGRELDAMVAERVMGEACAHDVQYMTREEIVADNRREFREEYGQDAPPSWEGNTWEGTDYEPKLCVKCGKTGLGGRIGIQCPPYSTQITAAWLVVERMRADGFSVSVSVDERTDVKHPYACEIAKASWRGSEYEDAVSAPLAICLAALSARRSTGGE